MDKFIFTFGSGQLKGYAVVPSLVMLVVEADTENLARQQVFDSKIGDKFCTSYKFEDMVEKCVCDWGMDEFSLEELLGRDRSPCKDNQGVENDNTSK